MAKNRTPMEHELWKQYTLDLVQLHSNNLETWNEILGIARTMREDSNKTMHAHLEEVAINGSTEATCSIRQLVMDIFTMMEEKADE